MPSAGPDPSSTVPKELKPTMYVSLVDSPLPQNLDTRRSPFVVTAGKSDRP